MPQERSDSKRSAQLVGGDWSLVGCQHFDHRCCRVGHEVGCPTASHTFDLGEGDAGTLPFGVYELEERAIRAIGAKGDSDGI